VYQHRKLPQKPLKCDENLLSSTPPRGGLNSAELKSPRKCIRVRRQIFEFEPDLGLNLGQAKPKLSGAVPTDRHTTIPNDPGPNLACFDDGPKLLNNEIAWLVLWGLARPFARPPDRPETCENHGKTPQCFGKRPKTKKSTNPQENDQNRPRPFARR
jgi:hypothetical protein